MHPSPSRLPEKTRADLIRELNARLADGIDLHSQIKMAHWNVKGSQFPALHPMFESFANSIATFNDAFAERAVTLGGLADGTVRHVARASKLKDYPAPTTRDVEHVTLIADRIEMFLDGVRGSRRIATEAGDEDTVTLFTEVVGAFEKHAWFLRSTLA